MAEIAHRYTQYMEKELTIEQQQAIAIARARLQIAQEQAASQPPQQRVGGFLGQALRGPAQLAGTPVDLINAGLGAVGLPVSDRPFGGSESLMSGLAALRANPATQPPETVAEYMGATVGEAMGMTVPLFKLAQRLSQGTGVAANISRGITQEFIQRPRTAFAAEGAAAIGAGAARATAEQSELGDAASMGLEVLAATTASLGVSAISATARAGAARITQFTRAGAFDAASERVQSLVSDPIAAARAIEDLDGTKLMPSARTGEPGLMTLERAVLEQDPHVLSLFRESTSSDTEHLVNSINRSGKVADARSFLHAKRQRLVAALDARVEQAGRKATKLMLELDGNTTPEELSAVLRQQMESALADAKAQEHLLWGAVPESTVVPIGQLKATVANLKKTLPLAQIDDMPSVVDSVMGVIGKGASSTLREVDGLYKNLGEVGRQARAAGQFNKARIADDIRDAIMSDLDGAGTGEVKQNLQTARAFSLEMHKKFRQGAVGKILGYDRKGGLKLAEEMVMESAVRSGTRGGVAVKELAAVDPKALDEVQSFLKFKFSEAAVRNGEIVPERVDTFMRQYRSILENFPHLKQQILTAKDARDVARRVSKATDSLTSRLQRPEVSVTARFLNAPVGKEVAAVFKSSDPEQAMQLLANAVAKDKSGKALEGLKTGVMEEIVDRFSSSMTDYRGRNIIRGQEMHKFTTDEQNLKILSKVFSPKEIKDLQRTTLQLSLYERQLKTPMAQQTIIDDSPGRLLDVLGSIIGAKAAAKFVKTMGSSAAGPSLQASQIGSRETRGFLRRLTGDKAKQMLVDAMYDPEKMRALLLNPRSATRGQLAQRDRILRMYIAGSGKRLIDKDEEEEMGN
jgi:hypothetical protein